MCRCRRLGTSPALGRWEDAISISPSSYLGCLGSLRTENGFAAMRSQERQDGAESEELGLCLLFGAVFFVCVCVVSTILKTSKEGELFSHLFALSDYGRRSRNDSGSHWVLF